MLTRLRELFRPRKKELPESYFVGEEYIKDPRKMDAEIEAVFFTGGSIANTEFLLRGVRVRLEQSGSVLKLKINRQIPVALWNDLRKHKGEKYILGYIWPTLPKVNKEISRQKYENGHLLLRPVSVLDIAFLTVARGSRKIRIRWPLAVRNFPFPPDIENKRDEIYVRDFIDAVDSYFRGSYDDCMRKLITSAENFFDKNKLAGDGFREKVRINFPEDRLAPRVLKNNLLFIYKLRNKIVHNDFRINPTKGWICIRAIGTLKYILSSPLNSTNPLAGGYATRLHMQFGMLLEYMGGHANLDEMEVMFKKARSEPSQDRIIHTPEDVDNWMFSSLEITNKMQSVILAP